LVVTWTFFSICERSNNEEIHGNLTLRSREQLHTICLMHHIFLMLQWIFCVVLGFLPILASMLSKEDMYIWQQLALCFKFYTDMMVYLTIQSVCPLLLCCEDNTANDVVLLPKRNQCFISFFFFLHRLYIQVSYVATRGFYECNYNYHMDWSLWIGVDPRATCHGLFLPLPFEKDLKQRE
jgi:hypothetical protein